MPARRWPRRVRRATFGTGATVDLAAGASNLSPVYVFMEICVRSAGF